MDDISLAKLITRRHPLYAAMLPQWQFMESTYNGGREWFKENIFRYHKEGDSEYADRVKRAYRFNHTREVVDLVNKYLFRGAVSRSESAPESVKKFWKQATRSGLSISEFARVMSVKSSIFGRPWVVVDSSIQLDSEKASQADLEKVDGQIYAYIVKPEDVLDLSYDENGCLNWILIREKFRDDNDPFTSDGTTGDRYRLWTRHDWHLVTPKPGQKAKDLTFEYRSSEHGLGEVPVVPVDNQVMEEREDPPALIADIAYLDRACANYCSNIDAIIQDQTFSQLTMPAQNLLPGDDGHAQVLEAGTKRVFTYDGQAGGKPEFISPDPSQAELILSVINKIIAEIYNSVGLAGENTKQDNAQGIDNSSGIAKSKDFERVNALLASKADALETAENRIARLVCMWSGDEVPEHDLVEYSDTFDVRDMYDEFYIGMQLALLQMPAGIRREQMIKILDKLFPFMADDKRKKLIKEIEEWEPQSDIAETNDFVSNVKSKLEGEAKRDREASGEIQSRTKDRVSASDTQALTE